jgi:galactokinase
MMIQADDDRHAIDALRRLAAESGLDIAGGTIRRSSSRFCLGVEHGDYNGTELFGVGTDRFIWLAYKPNDTGLVRLYSGNFPDDGVITFKPGDVPAPGSPEIADTWGRFPFGVDWILRREGIAPVTGVDAVLFGNIPGGGMSRSASLTINLILSVLDANGIDIDDPMKVALLAQAVENDYVGSPCGLLDQIMILFAKEGMGTHYKPGDSSVSHVPLGGQAVDFRIVGLDTGTVRPGLEKSTYRISGPELETMCDIARTVPGVLGERMLGGGDKGAAGALVRADGVDALATAVRAGYPRSHPSYADAFAVHVCRVVDGVTTLDERT